MFGIIVFVQVWHCLDILLWPAGMHAVRALKLHGLGGRQQLCLLVIEADLLVGGLGAFWQALTGCFTFLLGDGHIRGPLHALCYALLAHCMAQNITRQIACVLKLLM